MGNFFWWLCVKFYLLLSNNCHLKKWKTCIKESFDAFHLVWSLFKYKPNKCILNSRRLLSSGKNDQREIKKEFFFWTAPIRNAGNSVYFEFSQRDTSVNSFNTIFVAARVSDVTYRPLCLNGFIYSPTLNGTQHNKELSNENKLMHLIDVLLIWLNGYQHLRFYFALNHLFSRVISKFADNIFCSIKMDIFNITYKCVICVYM